MRDYDGECRDECRCEQCCDDWPSIRLTTAALAACDPGSQCLDWFRRFYPDETIDWSPSGIRWFLESGGCAWYGMMAEYRLLPPLRGVSLPGIVLADACMIEADLRCCGLSYASMPSAILIRSAMSRACLHRVAMRSANLACANLCGADVTHANLVGADLYRANCDHADLGYADLRGARCVCMSVAGASLRDADMRGAFLQDVDLLAAADLRGLKLHGATMDLAVASRAKKLGAIF
jgi:hypothetical protein